MPFPGAEVLFATDKRFATARPVIVGPREKAQPESVENDGHPISLSPDCFYNETYNCSV
jgi:hypothetical protein